METPRYLSEIFPQEEASLSWVPDGMDPNSSYRLAVRVGAYVKIIDDGSREYCEAFNIAKVLDRDCTNWNDLLLDIGTDIKLGSKQKLRVTYWDKLSHCYEEITSDQILLHAIDMYWEIRRLSLQVCVVQTDDSEFMHDIGREQSMPCVLPASTDGPTNEISEPPPLEIASPPLEPAVENNTEVPWVDDDVEYVGVDDEDPFKTLISDSSDSESDGDVECIGFEDDLVVDDAWDCETIIHATDLENPTIAVGVTFGDGDTFKKAIRQYAIKGEYEIAASYSESTRYRGFCKAARCKWKIHASKLSGENTWMIKKMPYEHTCCSTGKVEKNKMATNHWVRDRVLPWLATEPKTGPAILKKKLEELPFLGVDSTHLTGKWKGQLASATAIDGHNWMFPVCYGVFESETSANWAWFFTRLQQAIGSPPGLVISTDAGKGIDSAVTQVFKNGVEHRECMRHLVANFKKRFRGEVFEKHLWPACRSFQRHRFEEHYNLMYDACPEAMKWIYETHKHLWTRHLFSEASKCDYVTNNIAETFNSWIRDEKSLPVIDLMDRIRQMCMEKMFLRRKIARKLEGKVLPNIMKDLNDRSRGLKYIWRYSHKDGGRDDEMLGEVEGVTRNLVHWRHTVDLHERKCSCRRWQVTGLPCTHALCIITSIRGNIEDYVHEYYSIAKFKKAYENCVKPMTDRKQWPAVNLGFKLWPPILKRAAGRPRERRYKSAAEGGTTKKSRRCRRCKQFGHMAKTCNEFVYDSDAPPPAPPKPKRKRNRKAVTVVPSSASTPPRAITCASTPPRSITCASTSSPITRSMSRRLMEVEPSTPTRPITSSSTLSPMTRGRKRMLEVEGTIEPVACASTSPVVVEKGKAKKLKVVRSKKK